MSNVSLRAHETATAGGRVNLVVVGFSVRPLVAAAVSMGYHPVAIDHFTDLDCRELAFAAYQIVNWGEGIPQIDDPVRLFGARSRAVQSPVLLGGGTENWPELIEELHRNFRVLGPSLEQLRQLRSLNFWREAALATGILFPETLMHPPAIANLDSCHRPLSTSWLNKSMRGAGGLAIARLASEARQQLQFNASNRAVNTQVYQREIVGRSLGVHCILTTDDVLLLGVTESWSAAQWPAPREFIYRGSWGPIFVAAQQRTQIVSLCRNIQSATGCLGWMQLDFIEDSAGQLWLLEINPRWSAGMEILHLSGINPVQFHCAAWQLPDERRSLTAAADSLKQVSEDQCLLPTAMSAKAIVYAEHPVQLTRDNIAGLHALPRENYADLPALELAGQCIATGQPLLTVRARCAIDNNEHRAREFLLEQLHHHRHAVLRIVGPP